MDTNEPSLSDGIRPKTACLIEGCGRKCYVKHWKRPVTIRERLLKCKTKIPTNKQKITENGSYQSNVMCRNPTLKQTALNTVCQLEQFCVCLVLGVNYRAIIHLTSRGLSLGLYFTASPWQPLQWAQIAVQYEQGFFYFSIVEYLFFVVSWNSCTVFSLEL